MKRYVNVLSKKVLAIALIGCLNVSTFTTQALATQLQLIGKNDTQDEVFSFENAKEVIEFSKEKNIGELRNHSGLADVEQLDGILTAPIGLSYSDITSNSIVISWDALANDVAYSYLVFRDNIEIAYISFGGDAPRVTYLDENLQRDTEYRYQIASIDRDGNLSEKSVSLLVRTLKDSNSKAPSIPINIYATDISYTSLTLNWKIPEDEVGIVAGFYIYRNDVAVGYISLAAGSNKSEVIFMENYLQEGTEYKYEIAAFDTDGNLSEKSESLLVRTLDNDDNTSSEEWDSSVIYYEGDIVTFEGLQYRALWYTTNEIPDGQNANNVWEYIGEEPLQWRDEIPYRVSSKVIYNGNIYISRYWASPGDIPGEGNNAWEIINN